MLTADALTGRPRPTWVTPTALVANLPYNVAVPVVLQLLAELPSLRHGLVMVQKEVADRLTAGPGSRTYGVPWVKLAWYAQARPAGRVPAECLLAGPQRRVRTGRLQPAAAPAADRAATFAVVDAAFAQRRKMLRSALSGWAGGADAAEASCDGPASTPAPGENPDVEQFAAIASADDPARPDRPRPAREARDD